MKKTLKVRHYIRYADDFVVVSRDKEMPVKILLCMRVFLRATLHLELHPHKVSITTFSSGVDFLGWVHFPTHRVLRTATRKRMFWKLASGEYKPEALTSYMGLLKHGNAYKRKQEIVNLGALRPNS